MSEPPDRIDSGGGRFSAASLTFARPLRAAQVVLLAYLVAVSIGGTLLTLPVASADGERVGVLDAVFTATSAVCITGLTVVDTTTTWSSFGLVVILALIQIGGLGIMVTAALLALAIGRRARGARDAALTESQAVQRGGLRQSVVTIVGLSLIVETLVATVLAGILMANGQSLGTAAWRGVFHAISAFNNSGFALWPRLDQAPGGLWLVLTMVFALIFGGLGVPVWLDLRRRVTGRRWLSLHTKLTLVASAGLLAFGTVMLLGFESTNDETIGSFHPFARPLAAFSYSASARTAGFEVLPTGELRAETLVISDLLMFVGGGAGGTAGGIKVTAFAILVLAAWSELRGRVNIQCYGREISPLLVRQALAIALAAFALVVIGTLILMVSEPVSLDQALFETVSALGTVGLTTGITFDLSPVAKVTLMILMVLGRVGPMTFAAALALRERPRLYRYPEERVLVG